MTELHQLLHPKILGALLDVIDKSAVTLCGSSSKFESSDNNSDATRM